MKVECHPLKTDHLGALCEIAETTLVPVWSDTEYGYFLNHPSSFNLGLFETDSGRSLLGFVLALRTEGELDIVSLACHRKSQRQGLGSLLLDELLSRAQCTRAVLEVDMTNEAAVKLYLKKNFKVVGKRKNYYQQSRDAWVMAWSAVT